MKMNIWTFRNAQRNSWVAVLPALFFTLWIASTALAEFPQLPVARTLEGGIKFYDVSLTGDGPGQSAKLWIYLPSGEHAAKSLPCVFIAPAGSTLMVGMNLAEGDRPEHLPYVKAGFAVIAYTLDGPAGRGPKREAITKFMAAHGGVDDAKTAVDYALARVAAVDANRLYAAGHSSAATVALDVTAADTRIKACCAYAPCPNLQQRFGATRVKAMNMQIPGFDAFVETASPDTHVDELKGTPILLFTAADDANVPTRTVKDFAAALQSAGGRQIKLVTTDHGGHFQSMIDEGIPAGIAFLKDVDGGTTH